MRQELWPGFSISDAGGPNDGCPSVTPYLLDGPGPHPLIVVCPGGGYVTRARHEAQPIATWLNSIGVSAVVLNYRVAPYRHPDPLNDVLRAIRFSRFHAADWHVDPNRVGVLGFSAGGHLAASAGTLFHSATNDDSDEIDRMNPRPDFAVLCYAVVGIEGGTQNNLLGPHPDPELIQMLSLDDQVTPQTPPMFIWQTADDVPVPAYHALRMASALNRHGVPYELHIFQEGVHGLGLAEDYREVRAWTSLCEAWLRSRRIIRTGPKFTAYSTVEKILRHPRSAAILAQWIPDVETEQSAWMRPYSLRHLANLPESSITMQVVDTISSALTTIQDA